MSVSRKRTLRSATSVPSPKRGGCSGYCEQRLFEAGASRRCDARAAPAPPPPPAYRPRHPRRQRHPSLQRLRHHPHQHDFARRGAGEVQDDEGVVDGGLVGADADARADGGELVAGVDAVGAG